MRNTFTNNISTNIKLSKSQLANMIPLGRFLDKTLLNLNKKVLLALAVPLGKDILPKLANKTTLFLIHKFERKIGGKRAVRAGKRFTLIISYKDMDDINKIVELLEKSGLLIDDATETVIYKIKKRRRRIY